VVERCPEDTQSCPHDDNDDDCVRDQDLECDFPKSRLYRQVDRLRFVQAGLKARLKTGLTNSGSKTDICELAITLPGEKGEHATHNHESISEVFQGLPRRSPKAQSPSLPLLYYPSRLGHPYEVQRVPNFHGDGFR
jgi:hypothetical protein